MLPVWAWSPIQGASSYDLSVDSPDGTHRDFDDFRTPATSFLKMTGTGVFHWRVRANFPKQTSGEVPGPYSATQSFTRTIGEPGGAKTDSDLDHVLLSWNPRIGVKEYKVQIASSRRLQSDRRERVDGQHELRAADDLRPAIRRGGDALLARGRRSTRTGTRATGRRSSRSSSSRSCASPSPGSLRRKHRATSTFVSSTAPAAGSRACS